jgi:hypothetical protein
LTTEKSLCYFANCPALHFSTRYFGIEANTAVITGYNTDVEHGGVVYHVQTEDKGLDTPIILSLVYTGGAILASKRSPYDDLIANGFDQEALVERLQRQHKLICAAVHAGRIEELKRLGESTNAPKPVSESVAAEAAPNSGTESAQMPAPSVSRDVSAAKNKFSVTEESEESLVISLLDEKELRAGESVTLRIQVTRAAETNREPVPKASITLKTLGSSFQPSSTFSTTDSAGRSSISISLPAFKTGRGAILIRAEADGEVAELRRIIQAE